MIFCLRWKLHNLYCCRASSDSLRKVNFWPFACYSLLFLTWFRIAQAVQTTDDEMVSATVHQAAIGKD